MKRLAIAVASLFTVIGAQAAYDRNGNYYEPSDYRSSEYRDAARVIESRPVYVENSVEECSPRNRGCRTVRRNTLEGYDVRYSYRGQEYTTRMPSDPGRRLILGRDIRDDGTPNAAMTSYCSTVDPINRPGWCDSEGQGG